jgi:hypothetical protein
MVLARASETMPGAMSKSFLVLFFKKELLSCLLVPAIV